MESLAMILEKFRHWRFVVFMYERAGEDEKKK